jgi:hypothetical protein
MKALQTIGLILAVAYNSSTFAALVSAADARFAWTSDSLTGLDWLDFDGGAAPSTMGRSFNDVSSQFGNGGDYEGWRYASSAERLTFIFNATGVSYVGDFVRSSGDPSPGYDGVTNGVASFTGFTQDFFGLFQQIFAIDSDVLNAGFHHLSQMKFFTSGSPTDEWAGHPTLEWADGDASPDIGSWLVRSTSPVPLPGALWLLGSALGGFGLMRRRTA